MGVEGDGRVGVGQEALLGHDGWMVVSGGKGEEEPWLNEEKEDKRKAARRMGGMSDERAAMMIEEEDGAILRAIHLLTSLLLPKRSSDQAESLEYSKEGLNPP